MSATWCPHGPPVDPKVGWWQLESPWAPSDQSERRGTCLWVLKGTTRPKTDNGSPPEPPLASPGMPSNLCSRAVHALPVLERALSLPSRRPSSEQLRPNRLSVRVRLPSLRPSPRLEEHLLGNPDQVLARQSPGHQSDSLPGYQGTRITWVPGSQGARECWAPGSQGPRVVGSQESGLYGGFGLG